jgi:hypothetical protein
MLGEGIHRKVFECRLREDLVAKVEIPNTFRFFANVHEMKLYNEAPYAVQQWLAKPDLLSPDGRVMFQERVLPAADVSELPETLPEFLTDIKPENFGWVREGNTRRLVCVDYALVRTGKLSMKQTKVNWV